MLQPDHAFAAGPTLSMRALPRFPLRNVPTVPSALLIWYVYPSLDDKLYADRQAFVDPLLQVDNMPQLISPSSHPSLHHIPWVSEREAGGWSSPHSGASTPTGGPEGQSPVNSRPDSMKQRPHSFHAGSRRSSFVLGGKSDEPVSDSAQFPLQRSYQGKLGVPVTKANLSDISLPRSGLSSSTTSGDGTRRERKLSKSSRPSPPRQRRISGIFTFLASNSRPNSPERSDSFRRRISRRGSKSSKTSKTSKARKRGSKSGATPGHSPDTLNPPTAIRHSGTFGIHDDGSETFSTSEMSRQRSLSGTGTVKSQGINRVLYINNMDDDAISEDSPQPSYPPAATNPALSRQGSDEQQEVYYTPTVLSPAEMASTDSPLASQHTAPAIAERPAEPSAAMGAAGPMVVPVPGRQSPRSVQAQPSSFVSASEGMAMPLGAGTPFPTFPHPSAGQAGMSVHVSCPSTSSRYAASLSRPLPQTPSRPPSVVNSAHSHGSSNTNSRSPHVATLHLGHHTSSRVPMLHVPPPPSVSPSSEHSEQLHRSMSMSPNPAPEWRAPPSMPPPPVAPEAAGPSPDADLPLLIASHLLNSQAATLLRHSTTMPDAREVMQNLAKESLEWGNILLKMASTNRSEPKAWPPNASSLSPPTASGFAPASASTAPPAEPPRQASPDPSSARPTQQTWDTTSQRLSSPSVQPAGGTGQGHKRESTTASTTTAHSRPTARTSGGTDFTPSSESTRRRHDSLPPGWLGEADRLGKEGFENLRKAEDAWSHAMVSLRQLTDREATVSATGSSAGPRSVAGGPARPESSVRREENQLQQEQGDQHPVEHRYTPDPSKRSSSEVRHSRHLSLGPVYPRRMERAEAFIRPEDAGQDTASVPTAQQLRSRHDTFGVLENRRPAPLAPPGPTSFLSDQGKTAMSSSEGYAPEDLGLGGEAEREGVRVHDFQVPSSGRSVSTSQSERKRTRTLKKKQVPGEAHSAPLVSYTLGTGSERGERGGAGQENRYKGPEGAPATEHANAVDVNAAPQPRSVSKKHWWSRRRAGSFAV